MVFIREGPFYDTNYNIYFKEFTSLTLSNFQKWAIKAIVDGNHAIITAPTGSGKTLPAEFMIHHFLQSPLKQSSKRKKIIYASPTKFHSNKTFYNIRKRFPDISIGLITEDCKNNTEADVLIMTIDILRNTLFNKKLKNTTEKYVPLLFDIDICTEVAGIIFDKISYVTHTDFGSMLEQSILMLPKNIQMVLLSNIINKPKHFAYWIEIQECSRNRTVYLLPSKRSIVPLTHYMWLSSSIRNIKKIKDEDRKTAIEEESNKLIVIKDDKNIFHSANFYKVEKLKKFLYNNFMLPKRQEVINQLLKYLKHNNMLPAVCFIFSIEQAEHMSNEITENLNDDDLPSSIENECKNILISKLPNYKDFLNLPEYLHLIKLLKKGVAIHHSRMIHILREMVEILFEKGYIKMLFITETTEINIRPKSVIFSSLTKFDGETNRLLYPYEYQHLADIAGRRGIDKEGYVIHCNSIFKMPNQTDYNKTLTGPPQTITSKFKISYNFILNLLLSKKMSLGNIDFFIQQTLLNCDIKNDFIEYNSHIDTLKKELNKQEELVKLLKTPKNIIIEYSNLIDKLPNAINKTKLLDDIHNIEHHNSSIKTDLKSYDKLINYKNRIIINERYLYESQNYIKNGIQKVIKFLSYIGYIKKENNMYISSNLGCIASQICQVNCLAITYSIINHLVEMGTYEIAALLSCLIPLNVNDDNKLVRPKTESEYLNAATLELQCSLDKLERMEEYHDIISHEDYNIQYDLQNYIIKWAFASNNEQCQIILDDLNNIGITCADFIEAIIKICNICKEIKSACEITDNIELLRKIKNVPGILIKYVVTTQSLYV